VFTPLARHEVLSIAQLQLDRLVETARGLGKTLTITPEAVEAIVREGFSLAYGARYLKRVIDDRVKIPLSQLWSVGQSFRVDAIDGVVSVEATEVAAEAALC
jgi:ATP-dependent Clp protease ATP-binding subunit ClpA